MIMGLEPLKTKKAPILKKGLHLVKILDVKFLRDNSGKIVNRGDGDKIVVKFGNKEGVSDSIFTLDSGVKESYFKRMLQCVGIDEKPKYNLDEILGKKLYVAIKETHFLSNGNPVLMFDGSPRIEYRIFKYIPESTLNFKISESELIEYKND